MRKIILTIVFFLLNMVGVFANELNLNNQKKISYFADQIRFLEKLVEFSRNTTENHNEIN